MEKQYFRYATLDAPREVQSDLSSPSRQITSGPPTRVSIECGECGQGWDYRVVKEGMGYAKVTCPGCGRTEPYAGHIKD